MKFFLIMMIVAFNVLSCAPETKFTVLGTQPGAVCTPSELDSQPMINQVEADLVDLLRYENYIVKVKEDAAISASLNPSGETVREFRVHGVKLSQISDKTFSFKISGNKKSKKVSLEKLKTTLNADYIEPDYTMHTDEIEQSSLVADLREEVISPMAQFNQWSHTKIGVTTAWQNTTGSQEIVVAIVDSGVDYTHQDLIRNMWTNPQEIANGIDDDQNGYIDDIYGWDFYEKKSSPKSPTMTDHGTHVAGIIGANRGNGMGILGIATEVKMMALRFTGPKGVGGKTSDAIKAIDYAIAKNVFAINNSWGSGGFSKSLQAAIERAEKAGIIFIAASGNGDSQFVGYNIDQKAFYPAGYTFSNMLSVGSTNSYDVLAKSSNFGRAKVHVAAPGTNILSTIKNNMYALKSGTSMATPIVTGLAVLVKAANPTLTGHQVINVIKRTVDRSQQLIERIASGGRVNAQRAVQLAQTYSPATDRCE